MPFPCPIGLESSATTRPNQASPCAGVVSMPDWAGEFCDEPETWGRVVARVFLCPIGLESSATAR